MAKLPLLSLAAALLASLTTPALAARPVTDCPNRDVPFSADSPLIDLLLSPAAKAIIDRELPGKVSNFPARFIGTQPPTFAAILSLNGGASRFIGGDAATVARIDTALRALPVTAADKVARCARYDNEVPSFTLTKGKRHLLLFEKINGFRDEPSVNAAHAAFVTMAERKGWEIVVSDKGGTFNPRTLRQFDAVIWNNISGDVLSLSQRQAFRRFIENGGGFVGVHGTAGDPNYFWDWYADTLIGARFIGHPMSPQFQDARIVVDDAKHPAAARLPAEWTMNDEWYSFATSPRAKGARVIARLDESSYKPDGMMGQNLRMGADHPIAWTQCVGKGRTFYSAIGHRGETYAHPNYVAMLEDGIGWAAGDRRACVK